LTDVAIVYWPEDSVASALSACGARLTGTDGMLTLSAHERDLMTVNYEQGRGWSRTAHLRNLAFGFGIDVQSVELAQ
jgi:hypothetical protein